MSRLDSREYRWYAITTPPQKEFAVQAILDREGFATFVPAKTEWRYRNRYARGRGRKTEIRYPLMPRYVFIGMSSGTPSWERVVCFMEASPFATKSISGIISLNGQPYRIPNAPIWDLMLRHNQGRFNAPGYERYMETHREFAVGDSVEVEGGMFVGKVVDIADRKARVLVEFLGATREVDVELEKLLAAE